MFMLSLSLILWSGITFLLERWIDTFKKSINTPTYLLNVSVLDLYIGLMFLVVIIAKYCLTKTTRILGKDVESYIKDWFKSKSVCNKDKKVIQVIQNNYFKINNIEDYGEKIKKVSETYTLTSSALITNQINTTQAFELINELEMRSNNSKNNQD